MSWLKQFIKRILFGRHTATLFVPVQTVGDILERVILSTPKSKVDISERHAIVCHEPFIIAAFLPPSIDCESTFEVEIFQHDKIRAKAILIFEKIILNGSESVTLFSVNQPKNFQLNKFLQALLLLRMKNKDRLSAARKYAVLYSYPRQVVSVSFMSEDKVVEFPLDFQLINLNAKIVLLGLRNSNPIVKSGIKRLSIRKYNLPESIDSQNPEPDIFDSLYLDLEVIQTTNLGSHSLYVCKIDEVYAFDQSDKGYYHIHLFEALTSPYQTQRTSRV